METPDQVIEKLELMGEDEVRSRLARGHFHSRKIPLVTGWLQKQDQSRADSQAQVARQVNRIEDRRNQQLQHAQALAKSAQRQAKLAIGVAAGSIFMSILTLFAVALTR